MEKENKNLKIMLIIFILISVILGGFILYDKVLKKEDSKCKKDTCSCEKMDENVNDKKIMLASKYVNTKDKASYITFDSTNKTWNYYRNECHGYLTMTGTYSTEDNKVILNLSNNGRTVLILSHDNDNKELLQSDMISYGNDESNEVLFSGCSGSDYFMPEK